MARLVVPNYPHHVTQRGNRRQSTFFSRADYRTYLRLLASARESAGVDVWAYCLMPNHVHLVVVPARADSLVAFFREAHRRYTRRINLRQGWRGHLWQERFHSAVMDERHLQAAVRYTELNPVRAGLCGFPQDWEWSSAHAHLRGKDDRLVTVKPMLDRIGNWAGYLQADGDPADLGVIRQRSKTGRPIGDPGFVEHLERLTGRSLQMGRPGPKPNR
jgi:putative transposase